MSPMNPDGRRRSKYAARAVAAVAAYEGAQSAFDRIRTAVQNLRYTVGIRDDNQIYDDVLAWLLADISTTHARKLRVKVERVWREGEQYDGDLKVVFNDGHERSIRIDGHRVAVRVVQPEIPARNSQTTPMDYGSLREEIVFTTWTQAGKDAVLDHLRRIHARRKTDRDPVLRMVNRWGEWQSRADLPPRPLSSVVLPALQKVRIRDDLERFLEAEKRYNELAIPWHRGYLFHGPPGTGKTSLVKALATEFGLDLWYVGLSDLKEESGLMDLLARVSPRAMLLLEDIDTVRIATERDGEQGKISMSSLLNALDGVTTPHGLITVMTTNHFDRLDPAMTRAGRMDVIEQISMPGWADIAELYDRFYGRTLDTHGAPLYTPSMAEACEIFKRHLEDPDAALADLMVARAPV